MKVNIVCCEDVNSWILGKFASKMCEELTALNIEANISTIRDNSADVNHYIIYLAYDNSTKTTIDTLMITHIDTLEKLHVLKKNLATADLGICMSRQSMMMLMRDGIESSKLCFVNPAHDGVIKPRPIVIGITSRVYDDGRKKEGMLLELSKNIDPQEFSFKIMGEGWDAIVEAMRCRGFSIAYYRAFDYATYADMISSLDYYLYFSEDEGSMGFIDALSAGVPTIVTPQGYHLDVKDGIAYPIHSVEDIVQVLDGIAGKKRQLVNTVAELTWKNYTLQHVRLWKDLLEGKKTSYALESPSDSRDAAAGYAFADEMNMGWHGKMKYRLKLLANQLRMVIRSWKRKQ